MNGVAKWLPHLTGEIIAPARSNNICGYSIALEAWRRGLQVNIYDKALNHYSISQERQIKIFGFANRSKKVTFYLNRALFSGTPVETKDICRDKDLAKQYMSRANVPVPRGQRFKAKASNEDIVNYASTLGFPIVLKPTHSTLGFGVFANIQDEAELRENLILLKEGLGRKDVLIEEYIKGEEYRIFVIDNKVIGAIRRLPANITGNGLDTVRGLIDQKNAVRKKNPFLFRKPINIDEEVLQRLKSRGYNPESVPRQDELIYLRERPSLIEGGDSVDATDEISEETKKIAINANKSIPSLIWSGIDVIVPKEGNSPGVVLEINFRPQIGNILFPVAGQARDIPSAIIDYLFPNSVKNRNRNRKIYFNIKSALEPFKDGSVLDVALSPAPTSKISFRKITISGAVQGFGFKRWAQREAIKLNISGFAKNLPSGKILIVVAGTKKNILDFKKLCKKGLHGMQVDKVKMRKWDKPVMSGFRVK